jgi:predicted aconitase
MKRSVPPRTKNDPLAVGCPHRSIGAWRLVSESLLGNGFTRQVKDPDVLLVREVQRVIETDGYVCAVG